MSLAKNDRFSRVYKENFLLLRHFLGKFPSLGAEAEDLIHDVFLKFHRNMDQVAPEKETAYLIVAARNRALDHFQKARRRKTDSLGEQTPDQADALWSSDPQRDLEVALAGDFIDAVARKEPGGECFRMFYQEGHGIKEIAAKMNEPMGTIYSRISRLRERFKQDLRLQLENISNGGRT